MRKRKQKKLKAATGPKRATSSFFYYSNEIRPQIKRQHPDMQTAEMAKLMGGKWKELPADQKQKYEDMAAEDMARYRREKAAWDLAHPPTKTVAPSPQPADAGSSDEVSVGGSDDSD